MKYKLEIELELPEGIDEDGFTRLFVDAMDSVERAIAMDGVSNEYIYEAAKVHIKLLELIKYARGQENG